MRDFGIGGERWLDQFAFGFPITGEIPQKFPYPVDDNVDKRMPTAHLYEPTGPRFRERAAKSGHENAQLLWDEAMGQVQKGWLLLPAELAADGRPLSWRSKEFDIAFRFGALQQDKLRARDDLKRPMTNLAFSISTPMQLISWGHVSQLSQLVAVKGGDWALFKADRESAYKQLPIRPADMKNAIVALRQPSNGGVVWLRRENIDFRIGRSCASLQRFFACVSRADHPMFRPSPCHLLWRFCSYHRRTAGPGFSSDCHALLFRPRNCVEAGEIPCAK